MVAKICCIYDAKGESYFSLFIQPSTGAAIRGFSDEVNSAKSDSPVATHPEDYTLFELGTWDQYNGVIDLYPSKKSLGLGLDFKRNLT